MIGGSSFHDSLTFIRVDPVLIPYSQYPIPVFELRRGGGTRAFPLDSPFRLELFTGSGTAPVAFSVLLSFR